MDRIILILLASVSLLTILSSGYYSHGLVITWSIKILIIRNIEMIILLWSLVTLTKYPNYLWKVSLFNSNLKRNSFATYAFSAVIIDKKLDKLSGKGLLSPIWLSWSNTYFVISNRIYCFTICILLFLYFIIIVLFIYRYRASIGFLTLLTIHATASSTILSNMPSNSSLNVIILYFSRSFSVISSIISISTAFSSGRGVSYYFSSLLVYLRD